MSKDDLLLEVERAEEELRTGFHVFRSHLFRSQSSDESSFLTAAHLAINVWYFCVRST